MKVDVVLLPADLAGQSLSDKTVVVFDVLRATTTIAAAFSAGIRSIRAFADRSEAKSAAARQNPRPLLCGEVKALPAPGFDLGNSPRQFTPQHSGRDMILATTNGTKALAAARSAAVLFTAALVNASAAAAAAAAIGRDAVLLCSGSDGKFSAEDCIGAGAVCHHLLRAGYASASANAAKAVQTFLDARHNLPTVFRDTPAGHNIIAAGLEPDIDFAAQLDIFPVVAVVDPVTLVIRPALRQ